MYPMLRTPMERETYVQGALKLDFAYTSWLARRLQAHPALMWLEDRGAGTTTVLAF